MTKDLCGLGYISIASPHVGVVRCALPLGHGGHWHDSAPGSEGGNVTRVEWDASMALEPARQVSTTERVSIRISTNQYGVMTSWVSGEDGVEHGCTHAGHQEQTALWLIERLLRSSRESLPNWVREASARAKPE